MIWGKSIYMVETCLEEIQSTLQELLQPFPLCDPALRGSISSLTSLVSGQLLICLSVKEEWTPVGACSALSMGKQQIWVCRRVSAVH